MRRYAVLYRKTTDDAMIIFRDDTDEQDQWFVMQENLEIDNAKIFCNALNRESGGARQ